MAQHDASLLFYHQDACVNSIEYKLKVFLTFLQFDARMLQDGLHSVERGIEPCNIALTAVFREAE